MLTCCSVILVLHISKVLTQEFYHFNSSCVSADGNPIQCDPDFIDAASQATITATSTCGSPVNTYYTLVSKGENQNDPKLRHKCDAAKRGLRHPPEFMIDNFPSGTDVTYWMSRTMFQYVHGEIVNITLDLGAVFDVSHVSLKFYSPRPESMAIFKKIKPDDDWKTWQYFSDSCVKTFQTSRGTYVPKNNEAKVLCIDKYSSMVPIQGGDVLFSTLEYRPSRANYLQNEQLQEWVKARFVQIRLYKLNTFGNLQKTATNIKHAYYYAISDLSIGGKCACNGHAGRCIQSTEIGKPKLKCDCQHHTGGPDCSKCLPLYNNRPWKAATAENVFPCEKCNCNGLAKECVYDETLRMGRCLNCLRNTAGVRCERCADNAYKNPYTDECILCKCNELGSVFTTCTNGVCQCRPGVIGDKCDRCEKNFHSLSKTGCKPCDCDTSGSIFQNSNAECDPITGACNCKKNVVGRSCNVCKPGYYNLQKNSDEGCQRCFCFGHGSNCSTATGFRKTVLDFTSLKDWAAETFAGSKCEVEYTQDGISISTKSPCYNDNFYFKVPDKLLGNHLNSYGMHLSFDSKFHRPMNSSTLDLLIEGSNKYMFIEYTAQNNPIKNHSSITSFQYMLKEDLDWQLDFGNPEFVFKEILSNITAIKIKGNNIYLSNIKLESASTEGQGGIVTSVENCSPCQKGYAGGHCEDCANGYHRVSASLTDVCIHCQCNNHGSTCNPKTGACSCNHNTRGVHCELCEHGFYGNALRGTANDCQRCPCPESGACEIGFDGFPICINCPPRTTGARCELCDSGSYRNEFGFCVPCQCNNNSISLFQDACDRDTGLCQGCLYDTFGPHCEICKPGYWGKAVVKGGHGNCQKCFCHPIAAKNLRKCDKDTGKCDCFTDKTDSKQCYPCKQNYFPSYQSIPGETPLTSSSLELPENDDVAARLLNYKSCQPCNCGIGAINGSCTEGVGRCYCKPYVEGAKCDKCSENAFNITSEGCRPCKCNSNGTLQGLCDSTGNCMCKLHYRGEFCDRCEENYFNTSNCSPCPPCYELVKTEIIETEELLKGLASLLEKEMKEKKPLANDTTYEIRLKELVELAKRLETEAFALLERKSFDEVSADVRERIDKVHLAKDLIKRYQDTLARVANDRINIEKSFEETNKTLYNVEEAINEIRKIVKKCSSLIKTKKYQFNQTNKDALETLASFDAALKTTEELTKEANKIYDMASEALNLSYSSMTTLQNIRDFSENYEQTVYKFKIRLQATLDELEKARKQSDAAFTSSKALYEEAKKLNDLIENNVKQMDPFLIEKQNYTLIELRRRTERFNNITQDFLNDPIQTDLLEKVKKELGEAEAVSNRLDKILAEMDSLASEAKEKKNEIKRLMKLTNDQYINMYGKIETSRNRANIKVDQDFRNIAKVLGNPNNLNKSEFAKEKLQQYEEDIRIMDSVLDKCVTEQQSVIPKINFALEDIRQFNQDANELDSNTRALEEDFRKTSIGISNLDGKITQTSKSISTIKENVAENQKLVDETNDITNDANKNIRETLSQLRNSESKLKAIRYELNQMPSEKPADIVKSLKFQFEEIKLVLEQGNVLSEAKKQRVLFEAQKKEMETLENELNQIKKDVENIREINSKLDSNACVYQRSVET